MLRKIVTTIIVVPLAVVIVAFAVANRQAVTVSFDLAPGTSLGTATGETSFGAGSADRRPRSGRLSPPARATSRGGSASRGSARNPMRSTRTGRPKSLSSVVSLLGMAMSQSSEAPITTCRMIETTTAGRARTGGGVTPVLPPGC